MNKLTNVFMKHVQFELSDELISAESLMRQLHDPRSGAVVSFDGLVRNHNEGHHVTALEYQAYPALALRVGRQILEQECERHGVIGAVAVHRTGLIEVGASAVFLAVSGEHRQETFAAAAAILERFKYELPIWKKETYVNGEVEWVGPDQKNALTGLIDETVPLWRARLEEIWISPGNDFRGRHGIARANHGVVRMDRIECVAGMGLRGDRYFGYKPNYKGQVTFFDAAVRDLVAEEFGIPGLCASAFRRNAIVRGVRLADWIGKRFVFQGLEFEGSEECKPCYWMNEAVAPGVEDFLKSECRGGLRARILSDGVLESEQTLRQG